MSLAIAVQKKGADGSASPSSLSSTEISKGLAEVKISETDSTLGVPADEKRFWFQRAIKYDPDAIATQNLKKFDPSARWTWGEEHRLIRKIDFRIMIWACIMFMSLELDRANIQQANTDNFLKDLKLTTNDYNLGNTVFKAAFLCAELPSQLVSKWIGPDRWIPAQMILWSFVALSQFWLSGRTSFLTCRALLGILQGGFIPDIILYLSYFYKHHELSLRLGFFWTAMSGADILSGIFAFGILHLRGTQGKSGWRWLFLLEGLITLVLGIFSFLLMPPGPTQTSSWFRGKKGWFTEKEQTIIVNRVIREDPSKGTMHNRQPVTPKLLWKSMKDFDLWPLYLVGFSFQIPMTTPQQYLTLSLRGIGFNTFQTNLLSIPYQVGHIITMMIITYGAEITGSLTWWSIVGQIWALPFLIFLRVTNINTVPKWTEFAIMTLLLSYPLAHAIQVGWCSRNANTVRSRTVSAAMYNMFVQAGGIVASNIYRDDDKPRYKRGNTALVSITVMNIALYVFMKAYYVFRNRSRENKWNSMSEQERLHYLETTKEEGNKRLDFRFAH
ncbi:MFS general substrate transporter [Mytilinidion resinicola]|uniref:MFS general substrate transporter n=1 Tax=Mytilinidion resinicola TaxID=574789 RepID=A0A6A6Y9D1_9PEZI|nr:MFS general substrate transporter [Mytilinidion resinicola]KAF2805300.1 MFS general substrate transporter [Mytilinidion resinicola]